MPDPSPLLQQIELLTREAGRRIMAWYGRDEAEALEKADGSPLTNADLESHAAITAALAKSLPGMPEPLPVLSEEGIEELEGTCWCKWPRYWLVDPLDGTKEFLAGNGEFTVNIALIEHCQPVLGVVHAPALERSWIGEGQSAWRRDGEGQPRIIRAAGTRGEPLRVVASRSHASAELEQMLDALGAVTRMSMGSSLKFCLLAEGSADLYPRLGPTMEWDTAAADAVLRAAGGSVQTFDGQPLRYCKKELRNPGFVAQSAAEIAWRAAVG